MGRIRCCYGCVPPKRSPTCHGTCPDYIAAKAENDRLVEQQRQENAISHGLYAQKLRNIDRAQKTKRKGG